MAGEHLPADVQIGAGVIYVIVSLTGAAASQASAPLSNGVQLFASSAAIAAALLLVRGAARIRANKWLEFPDRSESYEAALTTTGEMVKEQPVR